MKISKNYGIVKSEVEGSNNGMLLLMVWLTVELWYGGTCFIYDYVELINYVGDWNKS